MRWSTARSVALDSVHRTVLRIGRQLWLAGADDHQHQGVLVSIVALAAGDAGRHRDRVARTERALHSLTVLFQRAGHVTLQDNEHLLHVAAYAADPRDLGE